MAILIMKNSSSESLLPVTDTESQTPQPLIDIESQNPELLMDSESQTPRFSIDTEAQTSPPSYTPREIDFGDVLKWATDCATNSGWLLFCLLLLNTGVPFFRLSQMEDTLFLNELVVNMTFSHIPLFAYVIVSSLPLNLQLQRGWMLFLLFLNWMIWWFISFLVRSGNEYHGRVSRFILDVR